jgi:uncharacterized protein YbjT (DUF2867 family)
MILITGGGGKTGRALVKALVAIGASCCGFVRRHSHGRSLLHLGAREIVVGDLRDERVLRQALEGATAIYHICPNMHPEEFEIGGTVIRAAKQAGIEHFVYHSVLHPQIECMPHHWSKMRVEELLISSGMRFTILQPAPYMQNLESFWPRIVDGGLYEIPYAAETRLSMVDLEDLAEAAASVLVSKRHFNATYELCGPDSLSQLEVVRAIGEYLGKSIELSVVTPENWSTAALARGLNDYAVNSLTKMFEYYEKHYLLGNSQVLEWILERPPTRLDTYIERLPLGA